MSRTEGGAGEPMMWRELDGVVWMAPGTLPGIVFWIFLISGAVASIVWAVGWFRRTGASPVTERASDVHQTRDAEGELGREQFEEMKRRMCAASEERKLDKT